MGEKKPSFFKCWCQNETCGELMGIPAEDMPRLEEIHNTYCDKCGTGYAVRMEEMKHGYAPKITKNGKNKI